MNGLAVEPFRVEVPEAVLEDLRARLAATRWPREDPVGDWSRGVPLAWDGSTHWRWSQP